MNMKPNAEFEKLFKSAGVEKTFDAGAILQFQDDPVDDLFLVIRGSARASNFERNGKEAWINCFNPGDLIGLEYILSGGPSQCQIMSPEGVVVTQFKRERFLDLMQTNVLLNEMVLKTLISQIQSFQASRLESHNLSKRGRVASEIKRMARPDCPRAKSYIIKPMPVISDMALRLGIARETVSRTVSELVKNQVLERNASGFIVPDLTRLEAHMR